MSTNRLAVMAILTCATASAAPKPSAVVPDDPVAFRAEQQKRCTAGDVDGCRKLALRMLLGEGGSRDVKAALTIWFQQCLALDIESCQNLGWVYGAGIGVPRNDTLAAGYALLACEHEPDGGGCSQYERALLLGKGVARDEKVALQKLEDRCRKGAPAACANAAVADELGLAGHKVDLARAEVAYKKACDVGVSTGCEPLGRLLLAHQPPDKAAAIAAFRSACNHYSGDACAQLAALVPAEAPALRQRACVLGVTAACSAKP